MRACSFFAVAVVFALSACDRHDWETKDGTMGTKELYTHKSEAHGDSHGEHKAHDHDSHAEETHAPKEEHGEAKH